MMNGNLKGLFISFLSTLLYLFKSTADLINISLNSTALKCLIVHKKWTNWGKF